MYQIELKVTDDLRENTDLFLAIDRLLSAASVESSPEEIARLLAQTIDAAATAARLAP